jgi:DNA-binding beta-propeller fold protein YncE
MRFNLGSKPKSATGPEADMTYGVQGSTADGTEEVSTAIRRRSPKRDRRVMIVVLILLVFLLLIATVFLLSLIRPKGEIASADDAGGVTWVRSIYGWGDAVDEQLALPSSVAFTGSGDLIIPNVGLAVRALRFSSSGVFQEMFAGSEEGFIAYPTAIDIAPDGRIYIVQSPRNEILVLDETGGTTEQVLLIEEPTAVDVTADRIAVGARAGWAILDLEGNVILGPVGQRGQGDDQYDTVTGIAVDDSNNVYVVDTYNNRISKFDAEGVRQWIVRTGAPSNQVENTGGDNMSNVATGTAGLQTPSCATLDGAGRLLVVDPLDFTISAFDTDDGGFVGKWGAFGREEGQFLYPTGIDYDAVRDWVAVADTMNNRVQIVRLPGTGGGATSAIARSLAGPIRACLVPLVLLLLAIIVSAVRRIRRRRALADNRAAVLVEQSPASGIDDL